MGPNRKTSRKFIGITKKSMGKNHHQIEPSSKSGRKKIARERRIACNEISLEEQIFH